MVTTVGQFKDYYAEIQQSYVLTPYRLHTDVDGTFITPFGTYDWRVYVMINVITMDVTDRHIETDTISSKLIYFVKGDGGSGVALQGDRGPSRTRGLKGDSGGQESVGSQGPAGKRDTEGPEGPPGKIGKMGSVRSKGDVGARGGKGDKGDTGGVGQQGAIGPRGSTGPRGVQGA